jgi:TonB-linked SusC/RagA family outer membrane protein
MKKISLILCMLIEALGISMAQKTLTGTVLDEQKNPIVGVSVIIKDTYVGTITDSDGKFQLSVPENAESLVISFIGMKTIELEIGNQTSFDIIMTEDLIGLDEVVFIGYGSVLKKDLTGSVATVKGSEIAKGNPLNVQSGLQGKIPGAVIVSDEGAPGSGASILIRGANSFSGSEPLYVVDGVVDISLSSLNPNDIASIEVLKDASSTAIYGSRGANGVVIVTTKKGLKGSNKVEYMGTIGTSRVAKTLDVLDAYTYALLRNEGITAANAITGTNEPLPFDGQMHFDPISGDSARAPLPEDYIGKGTNWQDIVFQNAFTQNHTLTISGGTDEGNHFYSFGFLDQEGVIIGSRYKRFTFNSSVNRNINKWIKTGFNMVLASDDNSMVTSNNTGDNVFASGVTRSAMTYPPTIPVIDTVTQDFSYVPNLINPHVYTTALHTKEKGTNFSIAPYIEAEIFKGLKYRQNLVFYKSFSKNDSYIPITISLADHGKANIYEGSYQGLSTEGILSYTYDIGKHSISAISGFTYENGVSEYLSNSVNNFSTDAFLNNNFSVATGTPSVTNGKSETSLMSGIARITYNFDSRFLATATYRADGSSKFSKNNKWAYFPSGAIAWVVSNEEFLKQNSIIETLKIRASYGISGNQGISPYGTQSKLIPALYPMNGSLVVGFAENTGAGPGNDNLKWESISQFDIGVDAALLKGRIGFTIDYYAKKTTDMLQRILIPGSTGFTQKLVNSGSIENKGMEFQVNGSPIKKSSFGWNINANISFNKNKILELTEGVTEQFAGALDHRSYNNPFIQKVGYSIGTLYGRVEEGIYKNEADVRSLPQNDGLPNAAVLALIGEIKYKDINGDGLINNNDRAIIGDVNPDFIYGIYNEFTYKNFDLSIFINGVIGGDIINMNNTFIDDLGGMYNTLSDNYENRWTPENWDKATSPKAWYTYTRNPYITGRYLESGTYLRIKDIVLGYKIQNISSKLENIRLYATASNLYTFTKYKGYSPDINAYGNSSRRGVDYSSYPASKSFNLGIQVNF